MGQDSERRAQADRSGPRRLKRPRATQGTAAELEACRHLQRSGLRLLQRNFRTRRGEIDLVMQDGASIVFVEVRSRTSTRFMHPVHSIDARKRARLLHAAQSYLQRRGLVDTAACRFDVVTVTGAIERGEIEWIRNAFEA